MIRKFIVFLVVLIAWLLPLAAFAGKVEFRDESALLSTPMRDSIVTRARRWSFSTRVLVSSSSATRSAFERRAMDALNTADMLVIGIDPVHRYTVVRVGLGLNLEPNTYSQIASAGNSSFKDRLWADGIGAIGDKAQSSIAYADYIQHTKSMEVPARPPVRGLATQSQVPVRSARSSSDAGGFIGWWLLGLIVTLIVICSVWAIIARRREAATDRRARQALIDAEADRILNADRRRDIASRDEAAAPVAPMPSRYQSAPREPSYVPPPRMVAPIVAPAPAPIVQHVYHQPAPPPAPVVIHQDRSDGLITGMLLNEAMHSSHHHHDHSDRHVVMERVVEVEREPASSRYDGSGASSSWSTSEPAQETSYSSSSSSSFESSSNYDGGGSSSSWDSGSSSSSFDSSSSSSSFDSGGGSSDF